ncbi:MAG: CAP domain-containing protein, partial [Chloroflexota bacterium]
QTPPPPTVTTSPACSPTGNADFESTLLTLINQERQNQGLAPYNLDSRLQAAARLHSTDMACNNFLSHTGSDGSSVGDRVRRQGYNWTWVGENIYATSNTSSSAPQQAFTWWMNSAPHRANLLSSNYTDIGIGYVYHAGSTYGGYFTAVFARP